MEIDMQYVETTVSLRFIYDNILLYIMPHYIILRLFSTLQKIFNTKNALLELNLATVQYTQVTVNLGNMTINTQRSFLQQCVVTWWLLNGPYLAVMNLIEAKRTFQPQLTKSLWTTCYMWNGFIDTCCSYPTMDQQ